MIQEMLPDPIARLAGQRVGIVVAAVRCAAVWITGRGRNVVAGVADLADLRIRRAAARVPRGVELRPQPVTSASVRSSRSPDRITSS